MGSSSESEIIENYTHVLLNSTGAEIEDLTLSDVRTVVDATQGRANQHIHIAMQPTRPSLSDAMRILNRLNDPAKDKSDGRQSHRAVLTPKPERGLVSIVGPNGLFYANAVGTIGVVPAGHTWGRLASAPRRWGVNLFDNNEFRYYYFLMTRRF